jgi:hypothetical protein
MKQVIIKILAQDIRETDYTNSRDCAITRALQRAGLNMRETGGTIDLVDKDGDAIKALLVTPKELSKKVRGMYKQVGNIDSSVNTVFPTDFEFTLIIPNYEE